jgi:arylformamidase
VMIGIFPWRFVDGESCISRCVAIVDDAEYESLMAKKAAMQKTKFGDAIDPSHVESINKLSKVNLS